MGQLAAAREAYGRAVAAVEDRRAPLRNEGLLLSLMGRWQQVYEALVLLEIDAGEVAAAFAITERARARAFADLLARRAADRSPADEPPDPGNLPMLQQLLGPNDLLLSYFCTGLRGPEGLLLDRLPPEAAGLRACLEAPARLICFSLERHDLRAQCCPLDPNLLHATSPRRADGRRFLQPAILRQLYDALVLPVADRLPAAGALYIAPHGPLHQVPFAALASPAGSPLLDLVGSLALTPSATIWARLRTLLPPRAGSLPMLALGYDGGGPNPLRHTEAEARAVAERCGGIWWLGETGITARLEEWADQARLLHLACHGTFDMNEPLRSALVIGPGEQLSAADVLARLRLRADLVTLSACRSGVSLVLRGDEPLGLVRSFLGAGARAVLVTLWPVEDTSARLLMERLYDELLARPDAGAGAAGRPAIPAWSHTAATRRSPGWLGCVAAPRRSR
jgi:hypothetical protein